MSVFIAGAHVSIADGFVAAAEFAAKKLESNALQLFLKSPRGGGKSKLTDTEATEYRKVAHDLGIRFTVAHASYLLNFAKDLTSTKWPLENLLDDLHGIEKLGGAGVILHIGKALALSREEALRFIVANLTYVLEKTKNLKAKIILENTAGQGTEIGATFEELAQIYRALKKPTRVQFCLDTCHAFAAGYDLRSPASVQKTFAEFDQKIGLKNLACLHFNDAKNELGSRVDRHENLGRGKIGRIGLTAVAKFAHAKNLPLILETPEREGGSHVEDLVTLKSWIGES